MAFPSYSDIWQNFQSGHFDVAAQAAIAKAELSQEQSYHYVTDAFAYYPCDFHTSLFIIQLVIIFILVVGIILLPVLKRRR